MSRSKKLINDRKIHNAKQRLDEECISYLAPVRHHLKCGEFNFYPTTGTIFVDGEIKPRSEKGIEAFIELLANRSIILNINLDS